MTGIGDATVYGAVEDYFSDSEIERMSALFTLQTKGMLCGVEILS